MAPRDPVGALEDLLERERGLILSGRVAELARHAAEKERLARDLTSLRDPLQIARLAKAARRNQSLLEGAAQGIRDVRARLTEMRASAGKLATYSRDGERQTVSTAAGRLEHRA